MGVGRRGYSVQECAVTVMDNHAAILVHCLLVQIQTMTHRYVIVSATAYSLYITVLAYDFLYIARVQLHSTTYVAL